MIGQTISHYTILEKPRQINGGQVGEVRNSPMSVFQRVVDNFRIPAGHINIKLAGRPLLFSGTISHTHPHPIIPLPNWERDVTK